MTLRGLFLLYLLCIYFPETAGSCCAMSVGRQDCEIFISIPRTHFDFLLELLSGANMFILEESPLIMRSKN